MTNNDFFNVVIIGSGPAGATTARFAAENGASVLILERDRDPGIPVRCAEGVSHRGLVQFIEPDPRWVARKILGARLYAPNGESVQMNNMGIGYVLERRIFDTALCELACAKGARMLTKADAVGLLRNDRGEIEGVEYRHQGTLKSVRCNIVVGADGVDSRVGRWGGIETALDLRDIESCAQYTLTGIREETDLCHFYFGNDLAPGGYVWVFPKNGHTANVGLGITGVYVADKRPIDLLDAFVSRHFPEASVSCTVFGAVPIGKTLPDLTADHLMLVGDAARQVNPATGGGIIHAMVGGSMAGRVAAEAVKKGDYSRKTLKAYDREWEREMGTKQRMMYSIKEKMVVWKDDKLNSLIRTLQKIPAEDFNQRELFKQAVKDDPKLVAEFTKAFIASKLNLSI